MVNAKKPKCSGVFVYFVLEFSIYIRRGHFEIFGLDFTENETAVLNVFQDLKSKISEKSDQN